MVVIRLYGVLEVIARRTTKLYVESFDEAMRALYANYPKLRGAMRDMRLTVLVDGKSITFEDFLRPYKAERIDIVPVVGGTGPFIPIIIGAMMSYGAATAAATIGSALMLSATAIAALTTFITNMGVSLILGGISQILFKPPKPTSSEPTASMPSYVFNGAVNTVSQGNCVPVGFGRLRVGSQVIAVNLQTFDVPMDPVAPTSFSSYGPPPANLDTAQNSVGIEIA
jgi:predicted phage tail protein